MSGKVTPNRMVKPVTPLGYDGSDFYALMVDADGHLMIDFEAANANRVLSATLEAANIACPSGQNTTNTIFIVPTGQYYVVTAMYANCSQGSNILNVRISDNGNVCNLAELAGAGAWDSVYWSGFIVLGPGWSIESWVSNPSAAGTLYGGGSLHRIA